MDVTAWVRNTHARSKLTAFMDAFDLVLDEENRHATELSESTMCTSPVKVSAGTSTAWPHLCTEMPFVVTGSDSEMRVTCSSADRGATYQWNIQRPGLSVMNGCQLHYPSSHGVSWQVYRNCSIGLAAALTRMVDWC